MIPNFTRKKKKKTSFYVLYSSNLIEKMYHPNSYDELSSYYVTT